MPPWLVLSATFSVESEKTQFRFRNSPLAALAALQSQGAEGNPTEPGGGTGGIGAHSIPVGGGGGLEWSP